MIKLTGAEMNAFMTDKSVWDGGKWYDDLYAEVDGVPSDLDMDFDKAGFAPDAKVRVEGGVLYRGGQFDAVFDDFETILRRWKKARTVTVVTLEVPNEQVEAFKASAKSAGCRVLA